MVFIPFIQSHPDSMYVNMTAIQADVLVSNKVNIPGGKLAVERIGSCTGSSQRSPKVRRQRIIPPIFLFVKTVEPILTGDALPTVFLCVCVCVNIPSLWRLVWKILLTLFFILFLSLSYRNQGITWSWLVSGKWEHRDVRVVSSRFLFELCVENYKHYSTRQRFLSHKMFVNCMFWITKRKQDYWPYYFLQAFVA